jgi:hypothetical protein
MVTKRQYKQVASLLLAVNELASHFKTFRNIKQIVDLLNSIVVIQADLKRLIFGDFEGRFVLWFDDCDWDCGAIGG